MIKVLFLLLVVLACTALNHFDAWGYVFGGVIVATFVISMFGFLVEVSGFHQNLNKHQPQQQKKKQRHAV